MCLRPNHTQWSEMNNHVFLHPRTLDSPHSKIDDWVMSLGLTEYASLIHNRFTCLAIKLSVSVLAFQWRYIYTLLPCPVLWNSILCYKYWFHLDTVDFSKLEISDFLQYPWGVVIYFRRGNFRFGVYIEPYCVVIKFSNIKQIKYTSEANCTYRLNSSLMRIRAPYYSSPVSDVGIIFLNVT